MVVAAGCHHDKYGIQEKHPEEVFIPPDEARFDNPPAEEWRRRPPKPQDKSLLGGGGMGRGPMGPGMGPGGGF